MFLQTVAQSLLRLDFQLSDDATDIAGIDEITRKCGISYLNVSIELSLVAFSIRFTVESVSMAMSRNVSCFIVGRVISFTKVPSTGPVKHKVFNVIYIK